MKRFFYEKKMRKKWKMRNVEIMQDVLVDSRSEIGEFTYIGQRTSITKTKIGRYCSIGSDVIIGPGNHPLDRISTSAHFYQGDIYEILTTKNVVIKNDVWIGAKAIIMRGVTIGNGAAIAAGSIVTKDVPDFGIVIGAPAKLHRYRFSKDKIDLINNSKWWEFNLSEAEKCQRSLGEF